MRYKWSIRITINYQENGLRQSFQIDQSRYSISEKAFIRINGLELVTREIAVLGKCSCKVYLTTLFGGEQKAGFNYYKDYSISKARVCSVDDLMDH